MTTTTERNPMNERPAPRPPASDVNWPRLMRTAERLGVPVLRVDQHGGTHVLRTVSELREEWE